MDHRHSLLMDAIAILKRVGRPAGFAEAVEMREVLESGAEPSRALLRAVDAALLAAVMSPRLLGAGPTQSIFFRRMTDPMPTREHVRRVYKEFVYAWRERSAAPNEPAAAWGRSGRAAAFQARARRLG